MLTESRRERMLELAELGLDEGIFSSLGKKLAPEQDTGEKIKHQVLARAIEAAEGHRKKAAAAEKNGKSSPREIAANHEIAHKASLDVAGMARSLGKEGVAQEHEGHARVSLARHRGFAKVAERQGK